MRLLANVIYVRYGTVRYGTVRYGTVRYGTVRYGTVRYRVVEMRATTPAACLSQLECSACLSCGHLPLARLPGREGEHELLVHCDEVVRRVGRERVLETRGDGEPVRLRRVEEDGKDAARVRVGVERRLEALHLVSANGLGLGFEFRSG